jgi:flagellar hook-associated protein 2
MAGITFGGLSSGLDTQALIDAFMTIERRPLERTQKKISTFQSQRSIIGEINSKLNSLSDKAYDLKKNTFDLKSVTVSNEDILTASADKNAADGSYSVTVKSLATRNSFGTTNTDITDIDTLTVGSGTFTISQAGTDYTVDTGGTQVTLEQLRDKINELDGDFKAAIVNTSADSNNPSYVLTITSNDSGTENAVSITNSLSGGDRDLTFNENVVAEDALIDVNGIEITRSTNSFSDAIPGVTLNLKKADLNETIEIEVATDTEGIKSDINDFINDYNALIEYLDKQEGEDGSFFGDSTIRNLKAKVRNVVGRTIPGIKGVNTDYTNLGQVGFKIESDGKITFDGEKFDDAVSDNFDEVKNLFETSYKADSTDISLSYKKPTNPSGDFVVDVTSMDDGSGNVEGTITYDGVTYTAVGKGQSLVGPEDSPLAGMSFYVKDTGTYNISVSAGLGDAMENVIDLYTDSSNGILTLKDNRLDNTISSLNKDIEDMQVRLDAKEMYYIQKFSRMESALSELQKMQTSLNSL